MGKLSLYEMSLEQDNELETSLLTGIRPDNEPVDSMCGSHPTLSNSFFLAKPDKQEMEELALDPDAHPGLESIKLGLDSEIKELTAGLLANGFREMSSVEKFYKEFGDLSDFYNAAKFDSEKAKQGYFEHNTLKNEPEPDYTMSTRILISCDAISKVVVDNYLKFYSLDKDAKQLVKLTVPKGFKLKDKVDISKLAPLFIESVDRHSVYIKCIPLEGFDGDKENFVRVKFELEKEIHPTKKELETRFFNIEKLEDFIYNNISPYLFKFKTLLKRLGSKDLKDWGKNMSAAGSAIGIGVGGALGGITAGTKLGAIAGSAIGPIGSILGGLVGGVGGAIGGMVAGGAAGAAVGAGAGVITYPVIKGVGLAIVKNRDKSLNEATKHIIDMFVITGNAKREICESSGIKWKDKKKNK